MIIALLLAGNATFRFEAAFSSGTGYGMRIGIGATIMLIMLIGGRIIPSFTRNWLAKRRVDRLPFAFDRFDVVAILGGVIAVASWIALPDHAATALLALVAGVLNLVRLGR